MSESTPLPRDPAEVVDVYIGDSLSNLAAVNRILTRLAGRARRSMPPELESALRDARDSLETARRLVPELLEKPDA